MTRFVAKPAFVRKRANGSARIVRDSYSNSATDWWTIQKEVMIRDCNQCVFCKQKAVDVHHVIPLGRGGTTTKSNLISLCKACHDTRHRGKLTKRKSR